MKISKINIEIKEKFFLDYKGLDFENRKTKLNKDLKEFLDRTKTKDIQVVETGEISNVYDDGKKHSNNSYNNYGGYFVRYYEGLMVIDGNNISMKVVLNKRIIDLALKEAGGEIKELVKLEYNEFENQLYELIDKTEKKNIFEEQEQLKFKEVKETILNNFNKLTT